MWQIILTILLKSSHSFTILLDSSLLFCLCSLILVELRMIFLFNYYAILAYRQTVLQLDHFMNIYVSLVYTV